MKHKQITEVSIDDEDLDSEFYAIVDLQASNDIVWGAGAIFKKVLTSSDPLTFSFTNVSLNKTITLLVTGDHALLFPRSVKILSGNYVPHVNNYIQIHCTETHAGYEEFWATISQEA